MGGGGGGGGRVVWRVGGGVFAVGRGGPGVGRVCGGGEGWVGGSGMGADAAAVMVVCGWARGLRGGVVERWLCSGGVLMSTVWSD